MQKALIGILAATTLALGILCAVQWKQSRASHEQARAAEAALRAESEAHESQEARVTALEKRNAWLDEQVQKFTAVTTQLRTNEARQTGTLAKLAERMQLLQKNPAGGGGDESKDGLFGKGVGEMLGKMMKDPAMREVMREQQKAMINLMYGGLFKDLNLAPEERDKLKGILTDAQMKNVEAAQALFSPGPEGGEGAAKDAGQQIAEAKKQTDAEIKALLGDERFAQYEEYQKNMGERMQMDQLKTQLAGDNPLRDDQTAQLLQAMKEEKIKLPPVIPSDQTLVPTKEMFAGDNLDKQLKWMEDYNRRVLERAGQILTPEQLKQYQSFQDQQLAMQRLGLQMAKQMFGGDNAGNSLLQSPPPPPLAPPVLAPVQ